MKEEDKSQEVLDQKSVRRRSVLTGIIIAVFILLVYFISIFKLGPALFDRAI